MNSAPNGRDLLILKHEFPPICWTWKLGEGAGPPPGNPSVGMGTDLEGGALLPPPQRQECPWVAALSHPPLHRRLSSFSLALVEQPHVVRPVAQASSTHHPPPPPPPSQHWAAAGSQPGCPAYLMHTTSLETSPPRSGSVILLQMARRPRMGN